MNILRANVMWILRSDHSSLSNCVGRKLMLAFLYFAFAALLLITSAMHPLFVWN